MGTPPMRPLILMKDIAVRHDLSCLVYSRVTLPGQSCQAPFHHTAKATKQAFGPGASRPSNRKSEMSISTMCVCFSKDQPFEVFFTNPRSRQFQPFQCFTRISIHLFLSSCLCFRTFVNSTFASDISSFCGSLPWCGWSGRKPIFL